MCGCSSNFSGKKVNANGCTCDKGGKCTCKAGFDARYSAFMGKVGQRKQRFVDTKKHGIPNEEYFAYNPKHSANFVNFTDERGFKHDNELRDFEF
jgi:hypothetical protein